MKVGRGVLFAIACVGTAIPAGFAVAQTMTNPDKAGNDGITRPSIATSLPHSGDASGARKRLTDRGVTYLFNYTNDVLDNVSGGIRRGAVDQGKLESILNVDLEKFAGLQGLTFYTNNFVIHNTGRIRRDYVAGINTIAAIEATPTVRLSELWLEKKFAGETVSVRIGQLAADTEFFYSDTSLMFLQSDWPTITAQNLPSGGPAYPLATPGVRLKLDPAPSVSFLLGMFNGDPAGPGTGDPDTRNRYGLDFRMRDPPFVIGEAQFRANQSKEDTGLARSIKIGAWTHFEKFNDQRSASNGTLLASPASSGIPLQHRGNWGLYGVVDQQIYRPRGGTKDSGVSAFAMASVSPPDRNQIEFYASGGIVFAGPFASRPDDRFGVSVIYAQFSRDLRAFDLDTAAFTGVTGNVRDAETNLEVSYTAQMIPGWTLQPNVQFIRHPSGFSGRDAKVVGLRSMVRF